ncbi:MAG TPA: DNA polymerase/3'-5' exonuclease PolX [Chloroflexota bacterium]|nr:DNA polymerase/3'-5' exonuclease PolX [Chloroflexota bacterium]
MNNNDVAAALNEIAELLELQGATTFRVRAYQNAGRTISNLPEDVRVLSAENRLKDLKGIGGSIADKIQELLDTGTITQLEKLRQEFPPGVRSIMSVPGVGPSLARRAYRELGVDSLEALREAAEDGRLAELPGFGQKSAENVLRALTRVNKKESRISIGTAVPLVEELIAALRPHEIFHHLMPGGSMRRWSPTIGDIDLLATSDKPERAMEIFATLPQVRDILGEGTTKTSVITDNGLQVDLRIVPDDAFGSLLQHFTGSKQHNIELRDYALARGLSLNEYGITDVKSGTVTRYADEESFYAALGLQWIPPELREGHGELAAARAGALPVLVTVGDVRGDLHAHTDWSDGTVTIEEMVLAARERGYEYVAITDHSGGIGVAHGLSAERLEEQIGVIRRLDREIEGITILTGTEVDIRRDGTLDFSDEILEQLDWVIASVHSGFNQPEDQMTARIVRAIENPHVDAIAHPTGRLIGRREPYAVDLEAVYRAAARTGTALEINSFPERLDLTDTQAQRALELGVILVVDTDAHAPVHFDNIRYGIEVARRAWAEAANVLNTRPLAELPRATTRGVPSP